MQLERFAVIGHPIGHTMSPFIHKKLFALSGLFPAYGVLDLADPVAAREILLALDGFNITIPHKRAIIPLLDELDEKAARFGSVNTVRVRNGKMKGYTTDGIGCLKALALHGAEKPSRVLLLGSGGAARAIAFALQEENPKTQITLAARSPQKGLELQQALGTLRVQSFTQVEAEKEAQYDLLVNATSVGMYPKGEASPVSAAVVARCHSVFDAVYNPHETCLLRCAKDLGKRRVHGIEMLVMQAAAAQEYWYGGVFAPAALSILCQEAAVETKRLFETKD